MGIIYPGFSEHLDLRHFERQSRRLFGAGYFFATAVLAILALTWHAPPRAALKVEKLDYIMHADIIVLPPQSAASPSVVQKPRSSPRALYPEGISRSGSALPGIPGATGKGVPSFMGERPYTYNPGAIQSPEWRANTDSLYRMPEGIASGETGRRGLRDLSLREEMVQSEDFIWSKEGQRTGMIEYNPHDKLAIRGIVPIPVLFSDVGALISPGMDGLREGILKYTDLTIGSIRQFKISQNTPLDYPFLYIAGSPEANEMGSRVAERIGEYLHNGGFMLFEGPKGDEFYNVENILKFIRLAVGPRCKFRRVPNDHPIYHCYFDFSEGAPLNPERMEKVGAGKRNDMPWLEGVWIEEQLVAVFSGMGYGWHWNDPDGGGDCLRVGINLLVYSLRQERGNTAKRYDASLKPGIHALRNIAGQELIPERNGRKSGVE